MTFIKNNYLNQIKAYLDLTRGHFMIVWPVLAIAGLMLAFKNYEGFSWILIIKVALAGLFGFEAGLILNDYVDKDLDKKDIEFDRLTKYWRPFNHRPLATNLISSQKALILILILISLTIGIILSLPFPNYIYVLIIMIYSYSVEYFYQIKKRNQKFPISQLIGRTDLSLFPIAGYLSFGKPDLYVILLFIMMYPWAQAHLALNDLIDIKNDKVKKLKTITVLYGVKVTIKWINISTFVHLITAAILLSNLGNFAKIGFNISFILLVIANLILIRFQNSKAGLKVLPLFHASLFIYSLSLILNFIF